MFDTAYLNALRRFEIEQILDELPPGCSILEFGSGTGEQARFLEGHGFKVTAIDLATSNYAPNRIFPVQDYDGHKIPLGDRSVDVIFSSNVLEHVENLAEISAEFRRILKPGGMIVHVLPTSAWRFWTLVTALIASLAAVPQLPANVIRPRKGDARSRALVRDLRRIASGFVPRAHGTGRDGVSELWSFSAPAWRRKFARLGFQLIEDRPMNLFYTGTALFGDSLPFSRRRLLSRWLGSATRIFRLRPC